MQAPVRLLLITLLLVPAAFAQFPWGPEGVEVVPTSDVYKSTFTTATNSQNRTLMVWSQKQSGSWALAGQLLAHDGSSLWQEGGRWMAGGAWHQLFPAVASDDDGWLIAWIDHRHATDRYSMGTVYAQRFDADGAPVWSTGGGDPMGGVPVSVPTDPGSEDRVSAVAVLPDGDGGVYVSWKVGYVNALNDVFLHHLLADGSPDPTWPEGGRQVNAPDANQEAAKDRAPVLLPHPEGGVYVHWTRWYDSYVMAVTEDGADRWPESTVLSAAGGQPSPSVVNSVATCSDGEGGLFAAQAGWRSVGTNVYAGVNTLHRVMPDGSLAWGDTGWFFQHAENAADVFLVPAEPGQCFLGYDEETSWDRQVLVQRFGGEQEPEEPWDEPVQLTDFEHNVWGGMLGDGAGGLLTWVFDYYGSYHLQHLSGDGELLTAGNGPAFLDSEALSSAYLHGRQRPDGILQLAWIHDTGGLNPVRQLRFDPDAHSFLDPTDGAVVEAIDDHYLHLAVLCRANDTVFTAFIETPTHNLRLKRFDLITGAPLDPARGVPLLDLADTFMRNTAIVPDGQGGAIVAVSDAYDNNNDGAFTFYFQRVDATGARMWGPDGVNFALPNLIPYAANPPELLSDGAGGVYAVFRAEPEDGDLDLAVQHISANGELMWSQGTETYLYESNPATSFLRDAVLLPDAGVIGMLSSDDDVPVLHMLTLGPEPVWSDPVVLGEASPPTARGKLLAADGSFITVYSQSGSVEGRRIALDGSHLWGDTPVQLASGMGGDDIVLAHHSDAGPAFWLAWGQQADDFADVQYLRRVSFDGELLTDPLVIETASLSSNTGLTPYADASVSVTFSRAIEPMVGDETWQPDVDLYTLRINEDGSLPPHYENGAIPLLVRPGAQRISSAASPISDGAGGFITRVYDGHGLAWSGEYGVGGGNFAGASYVALLRFNEEMTAVGEETVPQPTNFTLNAVYPNPFNASATVAITLPRAAELSVKVYDVLGRQVARLHAGRRAAGEHRFLLDGTTLASGVYFVHATVPGELNAVRKLVLLK